MVVHFLFVFMDVIIAAVAALIVGALGTFIIIRIISRSRAKSIVDEAKLEAEVIKKNKLLEAKEEEMKIKTEAEKAANARMSKVQSAEAKIKQREMQLGQMQAELQRKKSETDTLKSNLENQLVLIDAKKQELDKMQRNIQDTLEHVSGLSAEEAKEKLIESLKDESKTAAA